MCPCCLFVCPVSSVVCVQEALRVLVSTVRIASVCLSAWLADRVWTRPNRPGGGRYLRPEHEYVLWLDADVVKYPPDLVLRLYETNPHGVSAPLVVIEDSDTEW